MQKLLAIAFAILLGLEVTVIVLGLLLMAAAAPPVLAPALFVVTTLAVGLSAPALLAWLRSRQPSLSIAPYRQTLG
jgi:hypothetical protein